MVSYGLSVLPLVPLLPLAAFILIVALFRRPTVWAGLLSIAATGGAFAIAVQTLAEGLRAAAVEHDLWRIEQAWHWLSIGPLRLELSVFVDPIGAVMLVVVTLVSLLVQIYSLGYMVEHGEKDPGYSRFFAFLSLFTASMLGLVLANNFVQLFIFWELVGLCSYLLVGFWYHKPEAADAAKKAFLTTRFGDLGFLAGILIVFTTTGVFHFDEVREAVQAGVLSGDLLAVTMVLLFCGAIGKSAQFPLHVWLPDAMEGPTPVSALIHAATMVAAGVYMVARLFDLFAASPTAMTTVAWIGGFTALFAATHGLVMRDVKRVLAYSTVSQLGYMMLALGVGGLAAGVFHLTTHAFFKALLFLGAGSLIHASGEQDLFRLGGLGRRMPVTRTTFLIGALALAGVPPLAGFWSKDEILLEALAHGEYALLALGLVTAFLTALYIFRAYFLAFHGEPRLRWVDPDATHAIDAARLQIDAHTADPIAAVAYEPHAYYLATHRAGAVGDVAAEEQVGTEHVSHAPSHAHHERGPHVAFESPIVMTVPLVVLALLAIGAGFAGAPFLGNPFATFILGEAHPVPMNLALAGVTSVLALLAILIAWRLYGAATFVREPLVGALGPLYTLFARRYYLDDLYNWLIRRALLGIAAAFGWFDRFVIDGAVNLVGSTTAWVGTALNRTVTGRAPSYALGAFAGIALLVAALLVAPLMVR